MTISTAIFAPNSNYTISATDTSSNTALTQPPAYNAGGYTVLQIYNATSYAAFFSWGMAAQTATTGGFCVAPGAILTVEMKVPATNLGCILASGGSGSIYVSLGTGA